MDATREKIVSRIQKLYALAGNNPNEEEAQAAMLKAQELLYEHGVSAAEVESVDDSESDSVENKDVSTGGAKLSPWKIAVARVITRNFRCKFLISSRLKEYGYYRSSYLKIFLVIGLTRDVDTATETLKFALRVIPQLWKKYWKIRRESCWYSRSDINAIKDSYMLGFVNGLDDQFKVQVASKDLMIVVPDAVIERSNELSGGGCYRSRGLHSYDDHAKSAGYQDGRSFGAPHRHLPV